MQLEVCSGKRAGQGAGRVPEPEVQVRGRGGRRLVPSPSWLEPCPWGEQGWGCPSLARPPPCRVPLPAWWTATLTPQTRPSSAQSPRLRKVSPPCSRRRPPIPGTGARHVSCSGALPIRPAPPLRGGTTAGPSTGEETEAQEAQGREGLGVCGSPTHQPFPEAAASLRAGQGEHGHSPWGGGRGAGGRVVMSSYRPAQQGLLAHTPATPWRSSRLAVRPSGGHAGGLPRPPRLHGLQLRRPVW